MGYKYSENLIIITVFSFFLGGALAPSNDNVASPLHRNKDHAQIRRVWIGARVCQAKFWPSTASTLTVWIAARISMLWHPTTRAFLAVHFRAPTWSKSWPADFCAQIWSANIFGRRWLPSNTPIVQCQTGAELGLHKTKLI